MWWVSLLLTVADKMGEAVVGRGSVNSLTHDFRPWLIILSSPWGFEESFVRTRDSLLTSGGYGI